MCVCVRHYCRTVTSIKRLRCHQLFSCDFVVACLVSFIRWCEHTHDSMFYVCSFDTNGKKCCRLRVVAHFVCAKSCVFPLSGGLNSVASLVSFSPCDSAAQLACAVHVCLFFCWRVTCLRHWSFRLFALSLLLFLFLLLRLPSPASPLLAFPHALTVYCCCSLFLIARESF